MIKLLKREVHLVGIVYVHSGIASLFRCHIESTFFIEKGSV